MSNTPKTTRLRYVSSKDPDIIIDFLNSLGVRVQIYGQPVYAADKWYLWFVPKDNGGDISSINLDEL